VEAIRVERLSKSFGGVIATNEVSFRVDAGGRLVIIGPNGAGKSTLFNLLNGQLMPDGGKVFFFGKDVTHLPLYERAHMGMARSFQLTSLFPELTVLENMMLALHGLRTSRFNPWRATLSYGNLLDKAEELLSLLDLWSRRENQVRTISYGEQRKLEIALCLASNPRLLLLDEPSAGLTSAERSGVMEIIRNLPSHIAVIIVDHDMDLVFGLANRIIVLHYGQIIAEGTPEEIQANPKVREVYMGIEEERRHAGAD
jgi:branched-chain amino acid transport system ATP-binding protein